MPVPGRTVPSPTDHDGRDPGRSGPRAWRPRPDAVAAIAILSIGILAYAGSLDGAFVYDDRPSILENAGIRDLAAYVRTGAGARPSRYVGYLTFAVNYALGGVDVTGYRLVNVAIHLLNALLVYALVRVSFRTPVLSRSALAASAPAVAFAAAALFAAHPLAVQAVTYVVQRLTSLATTFYLAGLVAYARGRLTPEVSTARASVRRGAWYLAALLSTVAAMNTKEIAFTLPLCIVLYERSFFGPIRKKALLVLAPLLLTLVLVPMARLRAVGGDAGGAAVTTLLESATRVQSEVSRWDYAWTQLTVLVTYLRLLAFPAGQNFDHDHPVYTSIREPAVAGCAALLVALVLLAVVLFRSERREAGTRLAAFGIAWFFLAASVESSVMPIVDVIGEHRAYLPSVGFFVAVAVGGAWLARRWSPARAGTWTAGVAAAVAVVLAVATTQRNEVWASEISLWSDVVAKSPRKAQGHESLGTALADAGRYDEAARELRTAIELDPQRPEPYYNLGRVHLAAGARTDEAAALLARAVELRPGWTEAYANLAAALNRLGRYGEAIRLIDQAPSDVRLSPEARFNLGVAYCAVGDLARAQAEVAELRRLSPALAARLEAFIRR